MRIPRRSVVLGGAAATGVAAGTSGLLRARPVREPAQGVPGQFMGANAQLGHRLRQGGFPEPSTEEGTGVVVVGGGVAGLSAAWRLRRRGVAEVVLLELEDAVGGNAASGRNGVSPYPWGAHYVPQLTREATHARELFEELGVITGRTPGGDPVYDEYALCADPRERLYLYGRWQEDLVPQLGASEEDRRQYAEFFAAMERFRRAQGSDGRRAFAIPVDLSSADPEYRDLDRVTMRAWMDAHGWSSERLRWYVDYCCRDDYGVRAADASAWAGIHYFAARDRGGAQEDQPVLTWPQGNGWIVDRLRERLAGCIRTGAPAWRVRTDADAVLVDCFDPATGTSRRIRARAVVLAVPRFVTDRLLDRAGSSHVPPFTPQLTSPPTPTYAPWMVANVTLRSLPAGRGAPLCWDNVVYGSPSLGYVVATHQALSRAPRGTVLTYYWPLCDAPPAEARSKALARPLAEWQALVLEELLRIHPELQGAVDRVDVWLWGHGMVRPVPGFLWGPSRLAMCRQAPPVFFAHSDMSGISVFEEANYRGVLAADAAAEHLGA